MPIQLKLTNYEIDSKFLKTGINMHTTATAGQIFVNTTYPSADRGGHKKMKSWGNSKTGPLVPVKAEPKPVIVPTIRDCNTVCPVNNLNNVIVVMRVVNVRVVDMRVTGECLWSSYKLS